MSQPQKPTSVDVSDTWPVVKAGVTLRRKLILLAIPTVLAVVSVPVGIAHAHGVAHARFAAAPAMHVTRTVVKHVHAVAPNVAVKAAAAEPAETADTTTDPAETGTDTGHTDEVAGNTTESNVDHQFDGQE